MNSLFRLMMIKSLWFIITEETAHSINEGGRVIIYIFLTLSNHAYLNYNKNLAAEGRSA